MAEDLVLEAAKARITVLMLENERLQAENACLTKWALDSDETNDRLRAALRVNTLRWQPNLSHDEIDAEISRIVST